MGERHFFFFFFSLKRARRDLFRRCKRPARGFFGRDDDARARALVVVEIAPGGRDRNATTGATSKAIRTVTLKGGTGWRVNVDRAAEKEGRKRGTGEVGG